MTVLTGNAADEVTRLKRELDGDIVVYASYQLGRTLIEHDLVDELRYLSAAGKPVSTDVSISGASRARPRAHRPWRRSGMSPGRRWYPRRRQS